MVAGEIYCQDEELLQIRLDTRDLLYDFNHIHPRKMTERKKCSSKPTRNYLWNSRFIVIME
ncbi:MULTISPECIES: maltose acetyltransferase domain-containing protein [unclassified Enterococcus]|uniref:maltose acetyltransferase domain-containing protein n=1 Tax=unclassified Enterococcus TaxID=2608891 RepID=UPI0020CD1579|nr:MULTISPECIES: maltose acetyltransferase domain-containing protein [unclassified Enterococcus]